RIDEEPAAHYRHAGEAAAGARAEVDEQPGRLRSALRAPELAPVEGVLGGEVGGGAQLRDGCGVRMRRRLRGHQVADEQGRQLGEGGRAGKDDEEQGGAEREAETALAVHGVKAY